LGYLKAIGVGCCVTVLAQHIHIEWWEGMLLGFGVTAMII